jgi:flagellar motor protein MotB
MVNRYAPQEETPQLTDQVTLATLQVAAAKDGIPPIVGGSQNNLIFARVFLHASVEAVQSVQQAKDPQSFLQIGSTVVQFLDTLGPAMVKHLEAMKSDPSRQQDYKEMMGQLKQLEQLTNQLKQQLQKGMQQAQEGQQKAAKQQQQVMNDVQLKAFETQQKLRMAQQKTDAMIELKARKQGQTSVMDVQKHRQGMALADAETAAKIRRESLNGNAKE